MLTENQFTCGRDPRIRPPILNILAVVQVYVALAQGVTGTQLVMVDEPRPTPEINYYRMRWKEPELSRLIIQNGLQQTTGGPEILNPRMSQFTSRIGGAEGKLKK